MQRLDHPDPAAANAEALNDLENGATGLSLVFAGAVGAYGYGLDASEADDRARARRIHLCRHRARPRPQPADQGCRSVLAALVQARHGAGRDRHPLRLRSDRCGRSGRRQPAALGRARAELQCRHFRSGRPRLSRTVCAGGRAGHPQCRRLGGAGARLRAGGRGAISARTGSGRGSRSMPRAA